MNRLNEKNQSLQLFEVYETRVSIPYGGANDARGYRNDFDYIVMYRFVAVDPPPAVSLFAVALNTAREH